MQKKVNPFEKTRVTDLNVGVKQQDIGVVTYSGDNNSNKIGVLLFKGNLPQDITGTVIGKVIRMDGATVEYQGYSEGNLAYIILTESAFAYPGRLEIKIRVIDGDQKMVIADYVAKAIRTETGKIIDPGHVVPDVDDVIEKQAEIEQAINDANAAAENANAAASHSVRTDTNTSLTNQEKETARNNINAVATSELSDDYDPDTGATAGKYYIHAGAWYLCLEDTTGEWDGTKFSKKQVGGEVSELKSAIDEKFTTVIGTNLIDTTKAVAGAIQSNGTIATNGSYGSYATSDFIELIPNTNYVFGEFNDTGATLNPSQRKIYLLYNNKDEHDASTYISQSNVDSVTFNSGSHKYVRVSWVNTRYLPQLEIGTTISIPYKPYNATVYMETLLGEAGLNQIAATFPATESVLKEKIDHHDSATDAVGVIQNNGVLNPTATSYKTSDFIAIKNGYTYKIEIVRRYCIYDEEKVLASSVDCQGSVYWEFTASIDGYIRFSYPASSNPPSVTSVYEGAFVYKIEETIDFSERQKEFISGMMSDPLDGKKWAVCGDSFTNGATSSTFSVGKYAGMRKVYPYYIGNRTGIEVLSFFGGGRTLAFPAEPGDFVNSLTCPSQSFYYQNIPSDVDYITIYLGINDEHHSSASSGGDGEDNTGIIPIGTVDDNTTATYLGAWNVVLTWLITNRPSAHIGIIVTNGIANKDQYRQGQIAIAEKYGIPYIDLNGDARTPAMIRTSNPDIASAVKTALINKWAVDPSNNTHPNDAAHEFESTCIENFLRSL